MFALILTTAVMAVLFGLAWHNEPAKDRQNERSNHSPGSEAQR
ncbi:MAG TPA: hypothetical protein VNZ64_14065 [Candidatus Acidoferrum sp.]|jgi:hypothetical protein|nr:hypothetical protein [Candidatus Acidoferrum sp.]